LNARKSSRRGFTLIEVLLVILILSMLAGVGILAFSGVQDKAAIKTTRLLVTTTVPQALDNYKLDIGHYPTEDEGGLEALRKKPNFDDEAKGEGWRVYLTKEPKDAWGNALTYELVEDSGEGGGQGYKLWSNGPNGQSGDDDDIKNWSEDEEG